MRNRRTRSISVATAVIAVLAALGTLSAHHQSIQALTAKNQAILAQARASDAYAAAEAAQIRSTVYRALAATPAGHDAKDLAKLESADEAAARSYPDPVQTAQRLEGESQNDEARSEHVLKSYERLQIATTFFEISIALVAISALAASRAFLIAGCSLSAIGIAVALFGFFGPT